MARVRSVAHADLLQLTPTAAASRIGLGLLDAAARAHARLPDDTDTEALHDLRVALRRLRSLLRAYQPWVAEVVPRKLAKRLRRLARATNEARDAEVQLAWLGEQRLRPAARERAGVAWLAAALEARRARAYRHVREEIAHDYTRVATAVRTALQRGSRTRTRGTERFGIVTARLLAEHAAELQAALGKIGSVEDAAAIHAARIAAKRLRYLLEPVAALLPHGHAQVKAMKAFQDEFGLLNDSFVRAAMLADAVHAAGAERAGRVLAHALGTARGAARLGRDPLPGLVRLARRVQREQRTRYARLARRYLGAGGERFVTALLQAARPLTLTPARTLSR
jgi:CHAD domain-containing protein